MKVNPQVLYKTLVVGVVILFVGIGIQPAIATVEPKTSVNNDCNLCAKKDVDQEKVKTLLVQLEAVTKSTLLRYGHIPEVKENCEKVLDYINSGYFWMESCIIVLKLIWDIMNQNARFLVIVFIFITIILILTAILTTICIIPAYIIFVILPEFFYHKIFLSINSSNINKILLILTKK